MAKKVSKVRSGSKGKRPSKNKPYFFENKNVKKKLYEALQVGMTFKDAAEYAGIDQRTLRRWKNEQPEDPDSEHPEIQAFRQELKQKIAEGKFKLLSRVQGGWKGWQGSAWVLERCFGLIQKQEEYVESNVKVEFSDPFENMDESQFVFPEEKVREIEGE